MFASLVILKQSNFYINFLETFIYDGDISQNTQTQITEKQHARKWRVIDFTDYAIFDIIVLVCLFIQKSLLQVYSENFILFYSKAWLVDYYTPCLMCKNILLNEKTIYMLNFKYKIFGWRISTIHVQ